MSRKILMNSLHESSMVNRKINPYGLESYKEVERELNIAVEEITNSQECYSKINSFYNTIVSLESADYTEIIHQSACTIINRTIKSAKLNPTETMALESMSFNMYGIVNNVKNVATAVWNKVKEWFKKLLDLLEKFMIKYRNGFSNIANHIAAIGNSVVRGDLIERVDSIDTNSIDYQIGKISLTGNNIFDDFINLEKRYDELVGDPVRRSYSEIYALMETVERDGFNQKTYRLKLNRAVKTSIHAFNRKPPKTITATTISPTDICTDNLFAGAFISASGLKNVTNITLTGVETNMDCDFNMHVESSPGQQLISPISPRNMIRIAARLKDQSNPWIQNKDGIKYVNYGKDLLKKLNEISNNFPDEKSTESISSVLTTYNSLVLKLNTEMCKVYAHAVSTIYYVVKASVNKP